MRMKDFACNFTKKNHKVPTRSPVVVGAIPSVLYQSAWLLTLNIEYVLLLLFIGCFLHVRIVHGMMWHDVCLSVKVM